MNFSFSHVDRPSYLITGTLEFIVAHLEGLKLSRVTLKNAGWILEYWLGHFFNVGRIEIAKDSAYLALEQPSEPTARCRMVGAGARSTLSPPASSSRAPPPSRSTLAFPPDASLDGRSRASTDSAILAMSTTVDPVPLSLLRETTVATAAYGSYKFTTLLIDNDQFYCWIIG